MTMPKTCKAAILVEQKKPLVIDEIELPQKLEVGQVMVRVINSGICGTQIGEIDGAKGPDRFLPHLLGHEASAEVVATGPGVKHVKEGEKVVMHWRPSLGIQADPPSYRWRGEKLNAGWVTTFNEYAVVSENRLTPIPDTSDLEVAALFGCAVTTGFGVVVNNAKIKIGESVVVFGAGGIGLNIVQAAAVAGAYPVIAVDVFDGRCDLAKEMGATHTINGNTTDAWEEINKILDGRILDSFIDNTGAPAVIQRAYETVGPQGRVTLVGVPRKGNNIEIYSLPLHFGKHISGSHGGEAIPQEDIPRYMRMFDDQRLQLKELITAYYTLDEVNDAIQGMRDGSISGRCLIRM